jgi:Xaa-Pro aminopeptidase
MQNEERGMAADRFAGRRQRLLKQLRSLELAALLVTSETNVSYLTGFSGDSTYLIIGKRRVLLVSDSRYTSQIGQECPGIEAYIRPQTESLPQAVGPCLSKNGITHCGFESSDLSVEGFETLRRAAGSTEFVPTSALVETLRQVKDATELAETRAAVEQAQRGFRATHALLRGEQTELEVAHDLEHAMRGVGARGASFPVIVAAGSRSALPHARPTTAVIGDQDFVLIDWGATSAGGYRSDLTRVVPLTRVSSKLNTVYGVVSKAQAAAIAAIRPGVECRKIDAIARNLIADAGFGKFFGHGLGHGVGLDIHELPRLNVQSQTVLEPGMVVTVEPGIYLEGWGGVRLEDDVLVTPDGHEILTSVPRELEALRVS